MTLKHSQMDSTLHRLCTN